MPHNLFAHIPQVLAAEIIEPLLLTSQVRIERIISHGQTSPSDFWYDQPEHEWVLLVQGTARLQINAETGLQTVDLRPGDYCHLPAHQRHRVAWTEPDAITIWLAIFYRDV